jgi:hypothetical protein
MSNGKAILLVPRRYLRSVPTINADDFWDYCYVNENETLRNEYSQDVTKNVDKETIVDFARRHPEIRADYIADVEQRGPVSYDFSRDPKGIVRWYEATAKYCQSHPVSFSIESKESFFDVISKMVSVFQNYVENNEGWGLLWNDNKTPRSENTAQQLFLGIVKHYCQANNIDISREPDIGRGPVDFKVSHGYTLRALLELKLAKNTKFWNGLEKQLPTYQKAENVEIGYFIVIVYSDQDIERLKDIRTRVQSINEKTSYNITPFIVDARANPPSASKL